MHPEQALSNLNDLKGSFDDDDEAVPSFLADIPLPPALPNDESEAAHDQLPNVEEYKAQVGPTSSSTDNNRCLKIWLITALFVVAIVVSLTVGLVVGLDEGIALEEETQNRSPTAPTASAPEAPSPVAAPIEMTTPTLYPYSTRKYAIETLAAEQKWSDTYALTTPGTPQNRAATYMAEEERQLDVEATREFKERYALAVLYYAWNGDDWRDELGWLRYHHHCDWMASLQDDAGEPISVGVICAVDQTVTSINLPGNEMRGTIPPEIALLENLLLLDVSGAWYLESGDDGIPWEALAKLTSLRTLNLASNNFTGFIDPRLNALKELQTLNLSYNRFNGIIPTTIAANLRELTFLNLGYNQLEGTLDPLQDCVAAAILLGGNNLTGSLKEEIFFSWPRLETLDLSENKFEGELPVGLFAMETLAVLDLHANKFSGPLPDLITTNSALTFLALQENQLSGTIGDKYRYMTGLQHLDLSNNNFEGSLPDDFSMLPALRYLFLAFNDQLTPGPIPASYGSLMSLVDLSLQQTNRNGNIPTELGQLNLLHLLDLADNDLSGPLPTELGGMEKLQFLLLKDNLLSGAIPGSLLELKRLEIMVINSNSFSGSTNDLCLGTDTFAIESMDFIVSDCGELSCDCCICCNMQEGHMISECITQVWFSDVDPVYSPYYRYQRGFYAFENVDVQYPSQVTGNMTDLPIWFDDPAAPVDIDGDGVLNGDDVDADGDGTENELDSDQDGDGVADYEDAYDNNPMENTDTDGDGIGDNADGNASDADGDGIGDNVDKWFDNPAAPVDIDGDGVLNGNDVDADGDGIDNAQDSDQDGDGVADDEDAYDNNPLENTDTDGDGIGDNADGNASDASLGDADGDGIGDNADGAPEDATTGDSDGDGVGDTVDQFPDDPTQYNTDPGDDAGGVRP